MSRKLINKKKKKVNLYLNSILPPSCHKKAQSVTFASDCRSRGHEFKTGPVLISKVILLPSADLFKKVVVSCKQKYVHELFKLVQEKRVVR